MGLETASKISELNALWPTATDGVAFGDDHVRLLKDVLLKEIAGAGDIQDMIDASLEEYIGTIYPVGALYITADATDPATLFPGTTWEAEAEGRAIVGVGTADGEAWAAADEKGTAEHTLTTAQMPQHNHTVDPPSTSLSINSAGAHTHTAQAQDTGTNGSIPGLQWQPDWITVGTKSNVINSAGNHTHSGTVNIAQFNSGNAGSTGAHNNIQPSLAVYIWKRTA